MRIALLLMFFAVGCTRPTHATKVLEDDGYQQIQITGYSWLGCDKEDFFSTGFTAYKNDREISGVVCEGFFKGATIRFK